MKIYSESKKGKIFTREFNVNIDEKELTWHRDKKNRIVEVLESGGWYFQKDNEFPRPLIDNEFFSIKKNSYHRILKGHSKLKIKFIEY